MIIISLHTVLYSFCFYLASLDFIESQNITWRLDSLNYLFQHIFVLTCLAFDVPKVVSAFLVLKLVLFKVRNPILCLMTALLFLVTQD